MLSLVCEIEELGERLTVLVFESVTGEWCAQSLERDFSAVASNPHEAIQGWSDLVGDRILDDEEHGRMPLDGVGPAPSYYLDLLEPKVEA